MRIAVMGLCLVITGCASTSVVPLSKKSYAVKPGDCALDVFQSDASVKRPYAEIALITHKTGTGLGWSKDANSILNSMKAKACSVGADALILKNIVEGSYGVAGNGNASAIAYSGK